MLNRLKSTFDDARQAVGAAVGAESDSPGQGSVGRVVQIGAKSYRLTRLLAEGTYQSKAHSSIYQPPKPLPLKRPPSITTGQRKKKTKKTKGEVEDLFSMAVLKKERSSCY